MFTDNLKYWKERAAKSFKLWNNIKFGVKVVIPNAGMYKNGVKQPYQPGFVAGKGVVVAGVKSINCFGFSDSWPAPFYTTCKNHLGMDVEKPINVSSWIRMGLITNLVIPMGPMDSLADAVFLGNIN